MFETRYKPLLPWGAFLQRSLHYIGYAFILLSGSLGLGVAGYMYFAGLGFTDAFFNASMILTGMGPVSEMPSDSAKWFASAYALFSGVAFLTTVGVFFAPVIHRFLHKIHLDDTLE